MSTRKITLIYILAGILLGVDGFVVSRFYPRSEVSKATVNVGFGDNQDSIIAAATIKAEIPVDDVIKISTSDPELETKAVLTLDGRNLSHASTTTGTELEKLDIIVGVTGLLFLLLWFIVGFILTEYLLWFENEKLDITSRLVNLRST